MKVSKGVKISGSGNWLRKFWNDSWIRLVLELAIMLAAATLIYVNFHYLESIEGDSELKSAIRRELQQMLSISEKRINLKAYELAEEVRDSLRSSDSENQPDTLRKLDFVLAKRPWVAHVFLFDKSGFQFRSQPGRMNDPYFLAEHEHLAKTFGARFTLESRTLPEAMQNKTQVTWSSDRTKRSGGYAYVTSAFFPLSPISEDLIALGGMTFDDQYLRNAYFPQMLSDLTAHTQGAESEYWVAMSVYDAEVHTGSAGSKTLLAASAGWTAGSQAEASHDLDDAFPGLALGITLQGKSVDALHRSRVRHCLLILGTLSPLLIVAVVMMIYSTVRKKIALTRLKSDFESTLAHELRTPLALIRMHAETLELGRVKAPEKIQEYYRIIRMQSERLTASIDDLLDLARIECTGYELYRTDGAKAADSTMKTTCHEQIDKV